jgi:hypothetical protein
MMLLFALQIVVPVNVTAHNNMIGFLPNACEAGP